MDEKYWEERAVDRLLASEKIGTKGVKRVLSVYRRAEQNILDDLDSLFGRYSTATGVDKATLTEVLKGNEKANFMLELKKKLTRMGLNIKDVYDERYLWRIQRLEAMQEQAYWSVMNMAKDEQAASRNTYSDILNQAYDNASANTNGVLGISPVFNELDRQVADSIMREQWEGGNYSTRIWGNTDVLANDLPDILGGGFAAGKSVDSIAKELRQRFDVARSDATRLVRTESNYFHNQAELQSYVDDGIIKYKYVAVMDGKTSEMCKQHNGNIYYTRDAIVGDTYPPLHPNCRSTTVPIFTDEEPEKVEEEAPVTAVDGMRKTLAALGIKDVPLSDYERQFINTENVTVEDRASGRGKSAATYDRGKNTIQFTKRGAQRDTLDKVHTFYHELGHAIDYRNASGGFDRVVNGVNMRMGDTPLSYQSAFQKIFKQNKDEILHAHSYGIKVFSGREWVSQENIKTLMAGNSIDVNGNPFSLRPAFIKYIHQANETFAQAYALYRLNRDYHEEFMPNLTKYFDELTLHS